MMKRTFLSLFLFAFAISILAQETAQWRGPGRNGLYPETGLLKTWPASGPKLLWHFDELGEGHTSAAVTKDKIFVAGTIKGIGYIFALSPEGKQLWKMRFGEEWTDNWNGVRSTPLVHQGKVYIMSSFGKLVCMGAERGNIIWTVDLFGTYGGQQIEWGVTENLLIEDEKLFITVGGTKHNIIALNKDTGKLIWTSGGNGEKSSYGSPLLINLQGRKLLVTMTEKSLLGLDAATGKKLWRQELINTYGVHPNTPIYSNGNLFITTGYGTGGYMLKLSADGSQATKTWFNATLDPKTGGVVLLNGVIYGFGDKNRGFHGVDWVSGKTVFSDKFNQKGGSVIAADGMLYAYDESGEVALLQPTAGGIKKTGSFKVPFGSAQHWAHPVISNGKLFIRHGESLMVYKIN